MQVAPLSSQQQRVDDDLAGVQVRVPPRSSQALPTREYLDEEAYTPDGQRYRPKANAYLGSPAGSNQS